MAKVDQNTFVRLYAGKLDEKDGKADGKISAEEWNVFADYCGLDSVQSDIELDDAISQISVLADNNTEKIVNYTGMDGKKHPVTISKEEKAEPEEKEETGFWGSIKKFCESVADTIKEAFDKFVRKMGKLDDAVIDEIIDAAGNEKTTDAIDYCTEQAKDILPLSSRLLDFSAHPEKLEIGVHDGYKVLSAEESEELLSGMGMHRGDVSIIGNEYPNLSDKAMEYDTVIFDETSSEHDIISKSPAIYNRILDWIEEGQPRKKYYNATLNGDLDRKLSVNTCSFVDFKLKDNGDSYTVTGYVEDVYDFAETYSGYGNYMIDRINHAAYKCQQNGILHPYRLLIPFTVNIKKSDIE